MKILKGYVKYQARPEGCIAECYFAEECIKYCARILKMGMNLEEEKIKMKCNKMIP
eukprot:TRINITY_DN8388_c0_g1_i1.p2 TRINITY_DN8388_c0_g1~~TRINITY_DN8388_c0_g1_i1.p2  ORF type:complete len:56 (-),score=4.06 TRINITY_DN8388_c0_g1_i1:70-237(-)